MLLSSLCFNASNNFKRYHGIIGVIKANRTGLFYSRYWSTNFKGIEYPLCAKYFSSQQSLGSKIDPNIDYYKILGVTRGATDTEIKQAFYKLARKYHPDTRETSGTGKEAEGSGVKAGDLSGKTDDLGIKAADREDELMRRVN